MSFSLQLSLRRQAGLRGGCCYLGSGSWWSREACPGSLHWPPDLSTEDIHNLRVEKFVFFGGLTEDYSPGYSLSDCAEGLFQRDEGGASRCRSFFWGKKCQISKDYKITVIHKYRHFKLEIRACVCMGKCRSLGSLKSFLRHLNYLGPVSCFSPSWIPLRAHCRGFMAAVFFVYWYGRRLSLSTPFIPPPLGNFEKGWCIFFCLCFLLCNLIASGLHCSLWDLVP